MDFLIIDNYAKLKSNFAKYKHIKVFVDNSLPAWAINKVFTCLQSTHCKVSRLSLPTTFCSVAKADALADSGEDIVLALGGSNITSTAKYYAYCHIKPFVALPFGHISIYDFSKYAFLKDIKMCFYVCEPPAFVFIDSDLFEPAQITSMQAQLSYLNIVAFEKEFGKLVYNTSCLELDSIIQQVNNADNKLYQTAKLYASLGLMVNNHKTRDIVGSDYLVAGLLQLKGSPLCESLNMAENLLIKFYDCLLRFPIINVTPNLNLHLRALKQNFGISNLRAGHILQKLTDSDQLREISGRFHAYQPYLSAKFVELKQRFLPATTQVTNPQAFNALALAASINAKAGPISFARDCGYFEGLLKRNPSNNIF